MPSPPKPTRRPERPFFSSGPCAKRPGWTPGTLAEACLGRSHRSKAGKSKLVEVLARSRRTLGLPSNWLIGIVPGSDTGAVEMALWSLLGARGVDALAWESFGKSWLNDVVQQLDLSDVRKFEAPYGRLPDLGQVDFARDVIFTWNGTTSGVRVPDGAWIPVEHDGLVICDATSAAFAMALPWDRLDVVTWSWQKALGGEAAHGMIALSPRAVQRLESHQPPWPVPKVFQLASKGRLNGGIFRGDTINTPSLLCVEDAIDSLIWAESVGGLAGLIRRSEANFAAIAGWVARTPWIDFLAEEPVTRSTTSVCLKLTDPWFRGLAPEHQGKAAAFIVDCLERECAAFDIGSHRDAPPGLRIWAGATIEQADLEALFPWLDWAYGELRADAAREIGA
jgi:phosphoserine aminotransferase